MDQADCPHCNECNHYNELFINAYQELHTLRTQLAACRAALRKYGRHTSHTEKRFMPGGYPYEVAVPCQRNSLDAFSAYPTELPCTCGLDAALAADGGE